MEQLRRKVRFVRGWSRVRVRGGGHCNGDRRELTVVVELVYQLSEGLFIGAARRPRQARLDEDGCRGHGQGLPRLREDHPGRHGSPSLVKWQGMRCLDTIAGRPESKVTTEPPWDSTLLANSGCW